MDFIEQQKLIDAKTYKLPESALINHDYKASHVINELMRNKEHRIELENVIISSLESAQEAANGLSIFGFSFGQNINSVKEHLKNFKLKGSDFSKIDILLVYINSSDRLYIRLDAETPHHDSLYFRFDSKGHLFKMGWPYHQLGFSEKEYKSNSISPVLREKFKSFKNLQIWISDNYVWFEDNTASTDVRHWAKYVPIVWENINRKQKEAADAVQRANAERAAQLKF